MCVVNLKMTTAAKHYRLINSVIFHSLLRGNEVRFSDLIQYFIRKTRLNPFNNGLIIGDFDVLREHKKTDIWINQSIALQNNQNSKIPTVLIENKLKSFANTNQLKGYSSKFVGEMVQILPDGQQLINHLAKNACFFFLTPINEINQVQGNIQVTININQINNGRGLNIDWQIITYPELGQNIGQLINEHNLFQEDVYLCRLFKDFAELLMSFSVLGPAFLPALGRETPINHAFSNIPALAIQNHLSSLYSKRIASYCSYHLQLLFNGAVNIHNPNRIQMAQDDMAIWHDYSNGSGLFEIVRKIHTPDPNNAGHENNHITYIIQYQGKELRKGLHIHAENIDQYTNWLGQAWNGHTFTLNNNAPYQFKDKPAGYFFYYSRHVVADGATINDVIGMMHGHIQDAVVANAHNV